VNHSDGPRAEGGEPIRLISMIGILPEPRRVAESDIALRWATSRQKVKTESQR
jgi:hypothetical protein